ncbi:MAG: class I SAM-dependent methyltransferase, partial [Vicinamibacterales bacterium]
MAEKPLQDLLVRLERGRLEADRRYNDALTALDEASRALGATSPARDHVPFPYDGSLLPRVNEHWRILPEGAMDAAVPGRGVKGRLRAFIWRLVGPALEAQQQFNAALVEHLNRNVGAHEHAASAVADLREAIEIERAARARFHSGLIAYLQTITEYVDTKDRALGGPELREQIVLANERAMAASRAVERLGVDGSRRDAPVTGYRLPATDQPATDFSYVGFEDRFRGSEESIRARLEDYLPLFAGASDVLDVGCGRGELLGLLSQAGVRARGIDVNGEMVALCRERGFDAAQADALAHLESLPDASLGGLAAIQVVEHLEPGYLARLLEAAFHKLRPGAPIVLETINPACWMAFFEAYIRDLTHAQPIHPDTLRFLVQASGFSSVDIQFRAPVSESDRLDRVADTNVPSHAPPALRETIAAVNAHADKLNARLFSYMDYAV